MLAAAAPDLSHLGVSAAFLRKFLLDVDPKWDNLGCVKDALVIPRTAASKCTYIDLPHVRAGRDPSSGAPFVAPATVFLSHAWSYNFAEVTAKVALQYDADSQRSESSPHYYWIDIFCVNQNSVQNKDFHWFTHTFESVLCSTKVMLSVISPWNKPINITRAWCLLELQLGVNLHNLQQIELTLLAPEKDERDLEKNLCLEGFEGVAHALASIRIEQNATSYKAEDLDTIKKIIHDGIGFENFNSTIKSQLREWYVGKGMKIAQIAASKLTNSLNPSKESEKESERIARLYYNLGRACAQLGEADLRNAEKCFNASEGLLHKYNPHSPLLLSVEQAKSELLWKTDEGKARLAATQLESVLRKMEGLTPADPVAIASCHLALARALSHCPKLDDIKAAQKIFQQAIKRYEGLGQAPGKGDGLAAAQADLGHLLLKKFGDEDWEEALTLLASASQRAAAGEDRLFLAGVAFTMGLFYKDSGAQERAKSYLEQARAEFVETLGKEHPSTREAEQSIEQVKNDKFLDSSRQCTVITATGQVRCRNRTHDPTQVCYVHKQVSPSVGESVVCRGKKANGKSCGARTKNASGFCHHHVSQAHFAVPGNAGFSRKSSVETAATLVGAHLVHHLSDGKVPAYTPPQPSPARPVPQAQKEPIVKIKQEEGREEGRLAAGNSVICRGKTAAGNGCSKKTLNANGFCHLHQPSG